MSHPHLIELRSKVEAFHRRVETAYPQSLVCRRGCDACCRVDLSVFPVEAEPIRAVLSKLPLDLLKAIEHRRATDQHCVFLVGGECAVYDERPIICRSQGLPLQLEDHSRTACEFNFNREHKLETLHNDDVLNLKTMNMLLSLIHRFDLAVRGITDERVRLADLP